MSRSSSFHALNADRGGGRGRRALYWILNELNNRWRPERAEPRLALRDFRCDLDEATWQRIDAGSSPGRALSDLFWTSLPWPQIERELGAIHVVDSGCGRGGYARKLRRFSGGRIASYTGLDVREQPLWSELARELPGTRFRRIHGVPTRTDFSAEANLFTSQSALEHFEEDLTFFEHVAAFVAGRAAPVLQVHLVPSPACLRLYRHHGVRQYTPRTLSKITRMFPEARVALYRLGGSACNELHASFITRPLQQGRADRREREPAEYAGRLEAAIRADMGSVHRSPNFYGLLIHSRARSPLW